MSHLSSVAILCEMIWFAILWAVDGRRRSFPRGPQTSNSKASQTVPDAHVPPDSWWEDEK